uniref:Mitochondrial intermembrane space import and assembly protein 40 n=1 Tax=Sus scrofa TaxID=9823 RepID=A0A8D0VET3_PIG
MGHLVSHPRTHTALGTPSSSSLFQPQAGRVGVLCEHHLTSGFQVAQSSNGFPWLLGFRADLQILAETFLPVLQTLGKDRIIFVTKEDHETPSNAELVADDPNDPYEEHGLILPNGDINWNCPCLGGMASGPCGEQFKSAFSCFHYSTEEVKGSDCVDQFRAMQECMQKYPDLYPQEEEEEEERPSDQSEETAAAEASATKEEEGSS